MLATIDSRDYIVDVTQATAELNKTDADYQRYQKLYEKDAGFLKEEDLETQGDEGFFTLISGIQDLQFEYLKGGEDKSETDWQASWIPSEEQVLPLALIALCIHKWC